MNIIKLVLGWAISVCLITACEDKWEAHYDTTPVNSTEVEIYAGTTAEYLHNTPDLSAMTDMMKEYKILDTLASKQQTFTVLAYTNATLNGAFIEDTAYFAKTCISDIALSPSHLEDGMSILMWNGKYLAVKWNASTDETRISIGGSTIVKCIKTSDGYIYSMESPIFSPKSLYQYLCDLGDEYSLFRDQVLGYEEKIFDVDRSTPIGIDETGNTIYDSVFTATNSFLDRYRSRTDQVNTVWDIYSEYFNSTVLIPTNEIWSKAREDAYNNFRAYMGCEPGSGDSTRIEEWLVGACFYDTRLTQEQLNGSEDLYAVGNYKKGFSIAVDQPQWRPSVQKVDVTNPVELSNGVAYRVQQMRVPKNVIIWRVKSRIYQIWERADDEIMEYFNFIGLDSLRQLHDGGTFGGWDSKTPIIYYKGLRAQPTQAQIAAATNSATPIQAGLIYTACVYDEQTGEVTLANVPGGEYTLSMGFCNNSSSLIPWRLDIYLNDILVTSGYNPNGMNWDRNRNAKGPYGYSYIDYYNEGGGNGASQNYDTDGFEIGKVMVGTGNDDTNLYNIQLKMLDSTGELAKGGSGKPFLVYHWCLRPTSDNY